ncbi:TldD/PmbA family protein [Candidatus Bathyarchaeota archaeon]|nr:MAG: TldD/PmbA family protein [Candidatus Bathyarchaeota archaeon]
MLESLKSELEKALDRAVGLGASYADIRFQRYDYELIEVENRALKSYSSRRLSGVGVRVVIEGGVGFASTSDLSQRGIGNALDNAVRAAKALGDRGRALKVGEVNESEVTLRVKTDPFNVSPEEKVSLALDANKAAWTGDEIKSVVTRLGLSKDYRLFISSEGGEVAVETSLVGLWHQTVARVNGVMEMVGDAESLCSGFEFLKSKDWNAFTADISRLAIEAAGSRTPPPGTYPAVVDPEVVGLMLHEAFGHASEGDYVYTGESVLSNRLGDQLASDLVTIIDEGVVEGGYFFPFDDEGVRKGRTVIVEKGVLKGYIHDRNSAHQFGVESTGNGRAQDFENIPVVRQTNYYMEPGDHGFEELVEDIDFGIYLRGRGSRGGQVSIGMGTFTFGVGPSKMIRKGELAETVRGVVISGLILETLKTIDAVGKDLKITTSVFGGCGKKNQMVRVGDGGPHIRVRRMTVGGR